MDSWHFDYIKQLIKGSITKASFILLCVSSCLFMFLWHLQTNWYPTVNKAKIVRSTLYNYYMNIRSASSMDSGTNSITQTKLLLSSHWLILYINNCLSLCLSWGISYPWVTTYIPLKMVSLHILRVGQPTFRIGQTVITLSSSVVALSELICTNIITRFAECGECGAVSLSETTKIQKCLHKLLNNYIDVVILCCDWDSDPPCIVEKDI